MMRVASCWIRMDEASNMIGVDKSNVPDHLIQVGRSFEQTYRPVLEFEGWIVAMLRHCKDVSQDNFHHVERHETSNEVFIATAGYADLIVFNGTDKPTEGYVIPMELNVAYNIPSLVWHWVILSPDAHIILVERRDTKEETTDYAELTDGQISEIEISLSDFPNGR